MPRHPIRFPDTPPNRRDPLETESEELERRQAEQSTDRRRLRIALIAALILHGGFFLFELPKVEATGPTPPQERKVYRLAPTPRLLPPKPEPIPPPEISRTPRRSIPVPEILIPEPLRDPEPPPPLPWPEVSLDEVWIAAPPPAAPPAPDETGPIPVSGDVRAPVKLLAPQPRYPEAARRIRLEAPVVLRAVIDRQGQVTDLEVAKSAPFGLTEAALEAVRQWQFEPATLHGEPVAVFFYLTVDFQLR